jgi:hypothetical protein
MFMTLTTLAALITCMFVASVASTIKALRRENQQTKAFVERNKAF